MIHHPTKFGGHRHGESGDMNILAITLILPLMRDIRYFLCPLISAIIIFSKPHRMSYVTRVSNDNLRNSSYRNFFSVFNWIISILVTRLLGTKW